MKSPTSEWLRRARIKKDVVFGEGVGKRRRRTLISGGLKDTDGILGAAGAFVVEFWVGC